MKRIAIVLIIVLLALSVFAGCQISYNYISLETTNDEIIVNIGDTVDISDVTVIACTDKGLKLVVDHSELIIEGGDTAIAGQGELLIRYKELSTTLTFLVLPDFTVSFSTQGMSVPDITVGSGRTIDKLPIPEYEGHDFLAWYLDDNVFLADTPITCDITLTAMWAKKVFTVSFFTDSELFNAVDVEYEGLITEFDAPTRADALFIGWFVGERQFDFSQEIMDSFSVYAKWDVYDVEALKQGKTDELKSKYADLISPHYSFGYTYDGFVELTACLAESVEAINRAQSVSDINALANEYLTKLDQMPNVDDELIRYVEGLEVEAYYDEEWQQISAILENNLQLIRGYDGGAPTPESMLIQAVRAIKSVKTKAVCDEELKLLKQDKQRDIRRIAATFTLDVYTILSVSLVEELTKNFVAYIEDASTRKEVMIYYEEFIETVSTIQSKGDLYFGGGKGSENEPFIISEYTHLVNWSMLSHDGESYDSYVREAYFVIANDIDCMNQELKPLRVNGYIEGNSHVISNFIIINTPENPTPYMQNRYYDALIGYLHTGGVYNLGISNVTISVEADYSYVGGLIGFCNNSDVINCFVSDVTINIVAHSTESGKGWIRCGGLIGNNLGKIENCYVVGMKQVISVQGDSYVGGLIGRHQNNGSISHSYSQGTIDCESIGSQAMSKTYIGGCIGGIDGANSCIENTFSAVKLTTSGNAIFVGSFAGSVNKAMINCFVGKECLISGEEDLDGVTYVEDQALRSASFAKYILGFTIPMYNTDRYPVFDWSNELKVDKNNVLYTDEDAIVYAIDVKDGDTAIDVELPARLGYRFDGWYMNEVKFDFDTLVYEDITLVAKWNEIITYTVTFYVDGTEYSVQTVEHGQLVESPSAPAKEGYSFVGWYWNGNQFDFDTPVIQNMDLIAEWKLLPVDLNGEGTEENPYLICDKEEFNLFAEKINEADEKYKIAHFALTADIDMTGVAFTSIGSSTVKFGGVLDGRGHKISNLTISGAAATGLFAYSSGTIKSLVLSNVLINSSLSGTSFGGALVAYNSGRIENCVATGSVSMTGTGRGSAAYAGGLVGRNETAGVVTNCYTSVTVKAQATTAKAGGIVAQTYGNLSNCFATGNVTGTNAGAIVGEKAGKGAAISNCYYLDTLVVTATTVAAFGATATYEQLTSQTFITETLLWSADYWTFGDGYPMPKVV
ncbi:MAG: InlB B-repeat-containing protein [Clostridia bacterium]|nr:InlB B-repeat-containing protein [Clostridia bacterium]